MEYNIYRWVGAKPLSLQLPMKQTFVKKFVEENNQKKNLGYKRIAYVPGTDSIYAEDIKGDLKPQQIWFDNGDVRVYQDDLLLNKIMTEHPWFKMGKYVLWSQEKEDSEKLAIQRAKASARQLIDDADMDKVTAIALAVFGPQAINWTEVKCELELREYADSKPKKLESVMKEKDYEAKLLAGLGFVKGIVKENLGKTAVIWADSEGVIVKLAKGENGIKELGRYLANNTEETQEVLQSIGDRLEALDTGTEKIGNDDPKDKRIAELEAEIKKLGGQTNEAQAELKDARKEYKALFKKDVPNNKRNDLAWLKEKIAEEKSTD